MLALQLLDNATTTTAMKLIFTKDSPLNTTLVDETSGAVVYEIETEGGFFSKTTIIRKPFTSASSINLVVFDWCLNNHPWRSSFRSTRGVRASDCYRGCEDPVEDVVL